MENPKIATSSEGIEITGNCEGLRGLAEICLKLAELPEDIEEVRRLGNHYHYAGDMNNAEEGSTPLVILYKPDLSGSHHARPFLADRNAATEKRYGLEKNRNPQD